MRRLGGFLLLAAAIPTVAALVPLLADGSAQCAMACHGGAALPGASCCLLGGDAGVTLASCPGARDGAPPAPVCRLFPPNPFMVLNALLPAAPVEAGEFVMILSRPSEPSDPVPLALS